MTRRLEYIHPSVLDNRSSSFIHLFIYHRDHQVYWDHRGRKARGDFRARKVCWGQRGTKVNPVLRDRVERKVIGYVAECKFAKLFRLHVCIFLCTNSPAFIFFFLSFLLSRVKWVYLGSLVSLVYRGFKVRPELQVFRVVTVAMEQTYVYLDPIFVLCPV